MSASKNRLFAVVLATAILNVGSCFAFSDAAEVRNANEHYTDEEERLLASGHIIFPKKAYFLRAKRAVTVDPIAVHERNLALERLGLPKAVPNRPTTPVAARVDPARTNDFMNGVITYRRKPDEQSQQAAQGASVRASSSTAADAPKIQQVSLTEAPQIVSEPTNTQVMQNAIIPWAITTAVLYPIKVVSEIGYGLLQAYLFLSDLEGVPGARSSQLPADEKALTVNGIEKVTHPAKHSRRTAVEIAHAQSKW